MIGLLFAHQDVAHDESSPPSGIDATDYLIRQDWLRLPETGAQVVPIEVSAAGRCRCRSRSAAETRRARHLARGAWRAPTSLLTGRSRSTVSAVGRFGYMAWVPSTLAGRPSSRLHPTPSRR